MTSVISEDFQERVAAVSALPLEQRQEALEALYQELSQALDSTPPASSSPDAS